MSSFDFATCEVHIAERVATIQIVPPAKRRAGTSDLHYDLARAFGALRNQDDVRVIVLTGMDDFFYNPMQPEFYQSETARAYLADSGGAWHTFSGIVQLHEAMSQIEKPIVARVGGDAVGFGASLVFACDLIVAVEDVVICDSHLGMGEVPEGGPGFGIVPGDGGAVVIPASFPRALANEALLLARRFTADELCSYGIINRAVPRVDLDAAVNEIVDALLRRSAYALAWTKRLTNQHVRLAVQTVVDQGAAYEMVNFLQLQNRGGQDAFDLGD